MKRTLSLLSLFGALAGILVFSMLQTGCEEAKGLDGLTIDPSSATLSTNGQMVVFTVTGGITNEALAVPLTWTVSNGALGSILFSSGLSATYQRTSVNGVNTITARDQYDNEGYATVNNTAASYSLELSATATTIEVGQATTITITTAGSTAPYNWTLRSGPGSVTGDSGSKSAAYTSTVAGTGVIQVTDANGASGVIGIVVQDTSGGSGGGGGGPGGG
jgi:hypothetical protein